MPQARSTGIVATHVGPNFHLMTVEIEIDAFRVVARTMAIPNIEPPMPAGWRDGGH